MNKRKNTTHTQRKLLLKRLKLEVGPHKYDLYKSAFLNWIQFITRILSFYLIAQNIALLYRGEAVNILQFVIQLCFLNGAGYGISLLSLNYQGVASQYARNNLKKRFFQTFQRHEGEFNNQTSITDVLTVASQGIDSLDTYFHHYLSLTLRAYLNCATVLLLVMWLYPIGGLIFILSLPLIPISIILMQKRSKKIMQHYWATYMDVGNLFMDDLKGLNTLYTYDADVKYERSFIEKAEEFRQSTMSLLRFQLESVGYMDGVMYLGVGISGFFAVCSLAQGNLSLFSLIFFVLIAAEFFAPIREKGYGMHLVMMNAKMADRIYKFLDSVNEPNEIAHSVLKNKRVEAIRLENISFGYGEMSLFNHVNAVFEKGQVIAIAGESGLGKTTIAKLLQKQFPLQSGKILFDNINLKNLEKADINELVMYVSPNSYLFNVSILENLTLGCSLSKTEILHWLTKQGLLNFIETLPDGLETVVGENGSQLSPGQRQQILCARALLAKRPIYIFDEMTSSIDNENEQIILDFIKLTAHQAIVIFISHKMNQVMQADKVLFMQQNRQTVFANPNKLLAENIEFSQLVQTQNDLEAILYE